MSKLTIPNLAELRNNIKQSVIGQDDLVDKVTLTLYRHIFRSLGVKTEYIPQESVNNLLIIGETGTGKTFSVKKAVEAIGLPLIEINAKSICQEGWSGKSLDKMLGKALMNSSNPHSKTLSVVFVDEFDKICSPLGSSNTENYNEHLQASILKYIEGTTFTIDKPGLGNNMYTHTLNSANFCFIFAGAFSGMEYEERKSMGFHAEDGKKHEHTESLIKFGMLPELAGRMTRITKTNDFTDESYRDLLCNPNFAPNRWFSYFKDMELLKSEEPNYSDIINQAVKKKLGARGLIQLMEPHIDKIIEDNHENIDLAALWNIVNAPPTTLASDIAIYNMLNESKED